MASSRKIDYKSGIESLLKGYKSGMKCDSAGLQLISKLLNEINDKIILKTGKDISSISKMTEYSFHHCAKKALESAFDGSIKDHALAEAYKQLALLESGIMWIGDGTAPKIHIRQLTEQETLEEAKLRRNEMLIRHFRQGVKKFCSLKQFNFSVESEAKSLIGLRLYSFMKIVAEEAGKKFSKKDELECADIKSILAKYFGKDALQCATSEGNKCLLLFENGILDFKAKKKIHSDWDKESVVKEKIFTGVFKPSIKKMLQEALPNSITDSNAPKYEGHALMDLARYIAETTAEMCQKKKIYEIGSDEISRAVAATFPDQLKQHALLKGSTDVKLFNNGLLIYERQPDKPKVVKKKIIPMRRPLKGAAKRTSKRPLSKSSRKGSRVSSKRSPASSRKKTRKVSRAEKTAPLKLNFSHAINDIIPTVFENVEVILAKGTSNNIGRLLNVTYDAIASSCLISAIKTGELGIEEVEAAVVKVFPTSLAEHAVRFGLNVTDSWKTDESGGLVKLAGPSEPTGTSEPADILEPAITS